MRDRGSRTLAGFAVWLLICAAAQAADLRVLCSTALESSLEALAADFARASGDRIVPVYDTTALLKGRIEAGAPFDLAILTPAAISDLAGQGRIAGPVVTVAQAGAGLAVRAGYPRPDIATVAGFKRALLDARAVVYSTSGASGGVFRKAIETLGIVEAVKARGRAIPNGSTGEAMVRGEGDLAVQLLPELMTVSGADVVGPFPAELQSYVVMTAGISADAADPVGSARLVAFLRTPAAQSAMRAKGLEPR